VRDDGVGDLAVVLHSHMPYVEGFGTYPFGEEWLFDAVCRSYIPVLDVAERLTMTVTPVLADQLEAEGVAARLREFVADFRLGLARAEERGIGPALAPACAGEVARYERATARLEELGDDLVGGFRAAADRGVELIPSAATHAVLPLLASEPGRRLQIETGMRSHRRRFGPATSFWLPECGYEPGLERLLAEQGVEAFCVDQSAHEAPLNALSPVATRAGPVAFTIDWEVVSWLWSLEGYPSDPLFADFHRKSLRGVRAWSIGGAAYDPEGAAQRAREQAAEFVDAVTRRLSGYADERGRRGLVVFAIDTELLGHWWWEGPIWLEEVLRVAPESGIRLLTLSQARKAHDPEERSLQRATWGEQKDFRTWDSEVVADLAWASRRLELRVLRALAAGLDDATAARAARELLAVQASDWAFLDSRGQAGDYAFQRATDHGQALLEALEGRHRDPMMRNLAPELTLAPLLAP
jgi:1,4-alpha-glucan branching enzyme